jgi:hypothetical protein
MIHHHPYDHFSGLLFYSNGSHEDHAFNALQIAAREHGSDRDEIRFTTHEQIPIVLLNLMTAQHDKTGKFDELKGVVGHLTASGDHLPTNIARGELHIPSLCGDCSRALSPYLFKTRCQQLCVTLFDAVLATL